MSTPRLVFVVNDAAFFVSHRLPIARAALREGYDVVVAAPKGRGTGAIDDAGVKFVDLPLWRGQTTLAREGKTAWSLVRLYRALRPAIVDHFTIKPILYGSLAARAVGIRAVVNATSGLGYPFLARGGGARLRWRLIVAGYRLGFRHPNLRALFENPHDLELFLKLRVVQPSQAVLIRGAGVDLATFARRPETLSTPVVMLPSRMLWDKGVAEFVAAAGRLRQRGLTARFVLVGDTDAGNPAAVPAEQLDAWAASGVVEWWGHRDDMPAVLGAAHIVCLPSYREGLPKVLVEAAACGRAIVTTDVPGCREVVRHGENGLLVPSRDVEALATAIGDLIQRPEERWRMGRRGRAIAEVDFPLDRVVAETLDVYRELLS